MVDIETMGASSHAAIVSIGAVRFDPHASTLPESGMDQFYVLVNLASAVRAGMVMDASTVMWWLQQSAEARTALNDSGQFQMELKPALQAFEKFFKPSQYIWGHGATFDPVILWNSYAACKLWAPWKFRDVRDTRTLFDLVPAVPEVTFEGDIKHHALADARRQAMQVQAVYKLLAERNT